MRHNHDTLTVSQASLDILSETEQEGLLKNTAEPPILGSHPQAC